MLAGDRAGTLSATAVFLASERGLLESPRRVDELDDVGAKPTAHTPTGIVVAILHLAVSRWS